MTASPNSSVVQAIAALGESQARKLLFEWNRTDFKLDPGRDLLDSFNEQVRRTPDKSAIVFRDQSLSYLEFRDQTDRFAAQLRALGAGPEVVVALCIERSLEMVIALWGIIKAGAAYLPLDPSFPAERVEFMVRDSAARIILTQPSLKNRFEGLPAAVVTIDEIRSAAPTPNAATDCGRIDSRNLAYLTYTSGSTGTPKGVMVEHGNLLNVFAGMDQIIGSDPGVWLAVTSISFDISVLELLWTITRGFTVIVQAESDRIATNGVSSIPDQLRKHKITHFQCTPTLARLLSGSSETLQAMQSLRVLLLGGEALPLSLARGLTTGLTARVYNMYGPTETTVWSTSYAVSPTTENISIGRPMVNTKAYILDEASLPVPIGEIGELCIGGLGVARGYWNRKELTDERFIRNPFADSPDDRFYKTGDLARYREDGTIEFAGRRDDQVKINGFRIELGEVEEVLRANPSIQGAVVAVREDSAGTPFLVAFVVLRPLNSLSTKEMQIFARRKLPPYMVPTTLVPIDRIPVTPNGKIDRRALPALSRGGLHAGACHATRTDLQNKIVHLWQDALGLDSVGVNQNLFDLGATSLMVAEVASRLGEILDRETRVTELFAYPTISAFVSSLNDPKTSGRAPQHPVDRGSLRRQAVSRKARARVTGRNRLPEAVPSEGPT